jgi:hypothetical protein
VASAYRQDTQLVANLWWALANDESPGPLRDVALAMAAYFESAVSAERVLERINAKRRELGLED